MSLNNYSHYKVPRRFYYQSLQSPRLIFEFRRVKGFQIVKMWLERGTITQDAAYRIFKLCMERCISISTDFFHERESQIMVIRPLLYLVLSSPVDKFPKLDFVRTN